MKKLFSMNYVKQIANWVWRGRYHLLTFTAVTITILYIVRILNYFPNLVAAFLSITGLAIILNQLFLDARQFADQRPNTIRNWIMSFPTGKPIALFAQTGEFTHSADKVRLTVSLPANATIENRVDYLFRQVNNLQDEIVNVDKRIDDVTTSLTNKTKELRTDIENLNKSLKTIITSHAVGDYDINLFGIVITICGTLIQFFSSLTA